MARRATALQEYRTTAKGYPLFFLSGGHSFLPLKGPAPGPDQLVALSQAYSRFGYDLGLVTPAEAEHLRAAKAPIPPKWLVLGSEVVTRLIVKEGVRLGVVIFPSLPANDSLRVNVPEQLFKDITAAAQALRESADIVVGLSAWGVLAEQQLVETSPPPLDLLLGTGQGIGFNGRLINNAEILWMRLFDKGKALQRIDVLTPPAKNNSKWRQGMNISWATIPLNEKIYPDPGMSELFNSLDK